VGLILILTKPSDMRISILLHLSSHPFIPLPQPVFYLRVLSVFLTPHSFDVTLLTLGLDPFLFCSK
jgi:hypothetical protein